MFFFPLILIYFHSFTLINILQAYLRQEEINFLYERQIGQMFMEHSEK